MLSTDQHSRAQSPALPAPATDHVGVTPAVSGPAADDEVRTVASPSPDPTAASPSRPALDGVAALRTAAERSRAATLEVLQGHGKAAIELAQARSADEAEDLRGAADSDMAGIREWSATEMARIQAETDERLATRTAALERDLGDHTARVERELERISTAVATFAAQMDQFFGAVDQQPLALDLASAFAAAESEAAIDAAALEREERVSQVG